MITLDNITAHLTQECLGFCVFNSLCHHFVAQVMAHVQGSAHDGFIPLVVAHFGHERAVDLDFVDRQLSNVRER